MARQASCESQTITQAASHGVNLQEDAFDTTNDAIGMYIIMREVAINAGVEKASSRAGRLEPGRILRVVELVEVAEESRLRARIEDPVGWISIKDTKSGNRWARRMMPDDLPGACGSLGMPRAELSLHIEQLKSRCDELEAEKAALEERIKENPLDDSTITTERPVALQDLERRCQSMEAENSTLVGQISQLKREKSGLQAIVGAMEMDKNESAELVELQNKCKVLEAEKRHLEEQASSRDGLLAAGELRAHCQALEVEKNELMMQLQSITTKYERLRDEEELRKHSSKDSNSSLVYNPALSPRVQERHVALETANAQLRGELQQQQLQAQRHAEERAHWNVDSKSRSFCLGNLKVRRNVGGGGQIICDLPHQKRMKQKL